MEQNRAIDHIYILGVIVGAVYVQLILKWQLKLSGALPSDLGAKILFLLRVLLNPWIISCLAAAGIGFFFWVAAMTKFDLSYAYPLIVSLIFVLVLLLSGLIFREAMTIPKLIGTGLILVGVIIASRG
jgi:multidrug transporter EmrE-like cation transporter